MVRHIRGLEDHETQERKRLHRDVRSPSQRLADALKLGQVQTGGIFTAGLCLLLFPACATPLFCLGLALFLARCACVNNERLPFRMPMGLTGTDRGDPRHILDARIMCPCFCADACSFVRHCLRGPAYVSSIRCAYGLTAGKGRCPFEPRKAQRQRKR